MRKSRIVILSLLILSLALFLSGCGSTEPTNQSPNANFSANPTSGEAPLEVSFDASGSSDSDGSIIGYSWSFGDGSSGSGETSNHTFSSAGNYTVELEVIDNDGATDTATQSISVESSALSPPSWILGEWADEYDTASFTFSSDNVTYESMDYYSLDFGQISEEYYVEETSGSSSYSMTIPPEAWPSSQVTQDVTFVFDKMTTTKLNYSIEMGATTIGPQTLYKQ